MREAPPYIPVSEAPEQPQQPQQPQQPEQPSHVPHLDWTVDSMDVSRGNLDGRQDLQDPRSWVGWHASPAAPKPAQLGAERGNQAGVGRASNWTGHIIIGDQE